MTGESNNLVFLSYADENLEMVKKVYAGLKKREINVWFDKIDLGIGKWLPAIQKAISRSRYFIICLSNAVLKKIEDENPGFVDDELNRAYEIAMTQTKSNFTIIPVRLEDCGRGDNRLNIFQQYDLFNDIESGLDRLAINLGGVSLSDKLKKDERTAEEKEIEQFLGRADTLSYAGDFDKQLDIYKALTVMYPNNAYRWQDLGLVYKKLGRDEEAIQAYKKCLEIEPNTPSALYSMTKIFRATGKVEDAFKCMNQLLDLEKNNPQALWVIAVEQCKLCDYIKALNTLDEAILSHPKYIDFWREKMYIYDQLGRYSDSDKCYNIVSQLRDESLNPLLSKMFRYY